MPSNRDFGSSSGQYHRGSFPPEYSPVDLLHHGIDPGAINALADAEWQREDEKTDRLPLQLALSEITIKQQHEELLRFKQLQEQQQLDSQIAQIMSQEYSADAAAPLNQHANYAAQNRELNIVAAAEEGGTRLQSQLDQANVDAQIRELNILAAAEDGGMRMATQRQTRPTSTPVPPRVPAKYTGNGSTKLPDIRLEVNKKTGESQAKPVPAKKGTASGIGGSSSTGTANKKQPAKSNARASLEWFAFT